MQNQSNKIPYEGQFSTVFLNINIWTGQAALSENDIYLGIGGKLPSKDVASLGNKKLVDPKTLNVFKKIKNRAITILLTYGVRFMGGFAIPVAREKEMLQQLSILQEEYINERNLFVNNLDSLVEEWILANPEMENSLRAVKINPEKIEGKLNFEFFFVQIGASQFGQEELANHVKGMGNELINDVTQVANKLYVDSFLGRDYVTSRTLPPLVAMRDKIHGLSFLNSNFTKLVKLLNGAIQAYDHLLNKRLHQPYLGMVASAVMILSDEDKIKHYGENHSVQDDDDDVIESVQMDLTVSESSTGIAVVAPVNEASEASDTPENILGFFTESDDEEEVEEAVVEASESEEVITEGKVVEVYDLNNLDQDLETFMLEKANEISQNNEQSLIEEVEVSEPDQGELVEEVVEQVEPVVEVQEVKQPEPVKPTYDMGQSAFF